jgi:hypothetical protein
MINNHSVLSLIHKRYSCRSYQHIPIPAKIQTQLREELSALPSSPMGTQSRFRLFAAQKDDQHTLRGLTTYGFIKNPMAYIAGVAPRSPYSLEDFGYQMEYAVLYATSLGLGTVWLGGTFNKSRFSMRMKISEEEELPAVVATGLPADSPRFIDTIIRRQVTADNRKDWSELFFNGAFGSPLTRKMAEPYVEVIEMVRQAPSASNKQPWRIVRDGALWHLYLQRTALYKPRNTLLVGIADMQRIDIGIAMCHFELSAKELKLPGHWIIREPALRLPNNLTEYVVSWEAGV